jgi:hypothetical protein
MRHFAGVVPVQLELDLPSPYAPCSMLLLQ